MKVENIIEVEQEVKRFLKRLSDLKKCETNNRAFKKNEDYNYIRGCKESGALKRSSMDLSAALSKMRNDNY
tara:strand:+ start:41 stop:253 length:213 start_codon:yes stop_codon:yes gene_type:complete